MTNVEPFPQRNQRPEPGQPPDQRSATSVMNVGPDPAIEKTRNDRGDHRSNGQAPPQHSSSMSYILVMALSLICGALGAMGYAHFFESKSGEPSSRSRSDTAASQESSSAASSVRASTAEPAKNSNTSASTEESGELQQQIKSLNKRIDRLGERVDRVQELLSLAVPLLQRLAPK